uniref:Uncharacterized protein n=1 Tax=uncultured Desulfobacterium sp. TaxID=201089 RepID=E1YE06_9BACT|nr:hypothetical protein N47_B20820 [uncultured Desulfobacterium sp.]
MQVAPHAGAWIETLALTSQLLCRRVAPHAGAWIETCSTEISIYRQYVAPHAGAWIETNAYILTQEKEISRAPCGRVD